MDIFDEVRQALIASQLQSGGGSSAPGENGATFIPTVSPEGVISWENDKGLPNPSPINIMGPKGDAYALTDEDKEEIASIAQSGIVETVETEIPAYTNQIPTSTDTIGDVYNGSGIGPGLLRSDGSVDSSTSLYVTGFIPCKKGDVIRVQDPGSASFNTKVQFALYESRVDSAANVGKIVSTIQSNSVYGTVSISGDTVTWDTSTVGYYFWDNFSYARFTVSSPDAIVTINQEITNSMLEQKQLAQDIQITADNIGLPLYNGVLDGKKVVVFGDSIIGMVRDSTSVTAQIAKYTGADVVNAGFGGCRMSVHPTTGYAAFSMCELADAIVSGDFSAQNAQASQGQDYFPAQVAALEQVDFYDVDMIIIHFGTNDFSAGVQTDNSENPTDTSTLCGALRHSLNEIIPKYPQAKIFISVPLFRMLDGTSSDSYQNSIGKTLLDYINALSVVASEYHISCIDGYNQLGIQTLNANAYLSDGTHLSEIGRYRFGRFIGGSLMHQK